MIKVSNIISVKPVRFIQLNMHFSYLLASVYSFIYNIGIFSFFSFVNDITFHTKDFLIVLL